MEQDNQRDRIEMDCVVIDSCKGKFTVKTEEGHEALCTLSGKIRKNSVRILIGDRVRVEISPYDLTMGRIVFRYK